ncbi:MAG TPA: Hsp33 family molecular chaperone [Devosia sp.]|jgi:molecular chaperone Hsp33|nr:Hsp33 family molecular chaperone [Devosia sp.]
MPELQLADYGLDRAESGDDVVVPFTLEQLDSRGRVVRLGEALDAILTRHNYPAPVARLLGEAVVLAALIGSSLKFQGKFILQTQTDGPVNLIVVDLDAPDGLRGYARFDADAVRHAVETGATQPGQLLGKGHLAMTVDQGVHMERYQGIVALEGGSLEDVAHTYFQQSEQVPTLVRLAVAQLSRKGERQPHWRAGGVLVQHLPPHGARTMPDLPGDGDFSNPATADASFAESEKWTTTRALLATVADDELADPDVSAERLLFRLFHETGVRVFAPVPLEERCTCSAERIEAMLRDNFSAGERADMVVNGEIEVICEFCSADYHFQPHEFDGTKH